MQMFYTLSMYCPSHNTIRKTLDYLQNNDPKHTTTVMKNYQRQEHDPMSPDLNIMEPVWDCAKFSKMLGTIYLTNNLTNCVCVCTEESVVKESIDNINNILANNL